VTTQHFRREVPRPKDLPSVTLISVLIPWLYPGLSAYYTANTNFPHATRHSEVFTSWYCSAPWWYHKWLAHHTICLIQSVALLWILLPLCNKWQVLLLVWAITMASKDPKMSKQDTAGKRKQIAFNISTETWNNWEAWKWQKLNRCDGSYNKSSTIYDTKKQKDQLWSLMTSSKEWRTFSSDKYWKNQN